jgi:hypothetical protein
MARFDEPIEPMALGNTRATGVRSLDVCCRQCHHVIRPRLRAHGGAMPVPTFGPRMMCTRSGAVSLGPGPRDRAIERPRRAGELLQIWREVRAHEWPSQGWVVLGAVAMRRSCLSMTNL